VDDIVDLLLKDIVERKCIFFIGAGMAIDAGLPSGKHLTEILFQLKGLI